MNFIKQKNLLKKMRTELENVNNELHVDFCVDLINTINEKIGLINCYMTDDDAELESLAVEDGLRD